MFLHPGRRPLLFALPLLFILAFSACPARADALRLALLPVPDVFPAYVAEEKGFFKAEGVEVKLMPVGSAAERDQLMQAGQIDGMMNDLISVAGLNRDKIRVQVVSNARQPLAGSPMFRLLVGKDSAIKSVADLAGTPIAISRNTMNEYVTAKMLAALPREAIRYQSVPVLPERLQLLLSGQIKAAVIPDPLAFAAVLSGARELVNDTSIVDFSASVLTFSTAALAEKTKDVHAFMRAWDKACAAINAKPESFRPLFLQKIRVPKNIAKTYPIPQMPRQAVPSQKQWDEAMAWMKEVKIIENPPTYQDSVTNVFLP
ncbi:MAG: ABC transporter substrate-binding protein [Desulfobulbaceae bacterium]|jgi:NitT/TauT family transport system substrate-binding protein|nr:ABC transporter substrate-binding protein [Desulfobulbaceae bacterium]